MAMIAVLSRFIGLAVSDGWAGEMSLPHCPSGTRVVLFGGKPTKPMSTDSIPMFLRMNLPSIVSPRRTLMISPFPENVAIGFAALPNVPMYLYVNGGGTGSGGGWYFFVMGPCWQASPTPFSSMSAWSGLATSGQLSRKSGTPSLSRSGGGGGGLGGGGGGGGGGSLYAKRFRSLL